MFQVGKLPGTVGHSDIVDHPHGDVKMAFVLPAFMGNNHVNSLRSGLRESSFSNNGI